MVQPLDPDGNLMVPGLAPILKPLAATLLIEAYRQGADLALACELVAVVIDAQASKPATPRTLYEGLNLLTSLIEARRPF